MRLLLLLLVMLPLAGADLEDRVTRLLANVPAGGLAGVAVTDVVTGQRLVAHQAAVPLALASTTKAVVAAGALHRLGPQFRFQTQVYAAGPVVDGRVPGLGIIGGGDPCLDGHFSDDQPEEIFAAWATNIRQAGITRIEGDLWIDGRLFSGPIRPPTYPQDHDNQQRWYSAPASAFAWNDNCIEVRVVPTRVGQPAQVDVRPRSARITVVNKARTVAGKGDKAIWVTRDVEGNGVTVTGNYSQATPWFPVAIHQDPDLLAGDQLRASLIQAGIAVTGQARLGPVNPRNGPLLIHHTSPLAPALALMNQHSQNFYGEQILRILGFTHSREGSILAGARALQADLSGLIGEQARELSIIDGSGLSYGNMGSAGAMCALLVAMHRAPTAAVFYDSLKVKEVPRATVRVKTGTLAIATCLVGYLDPPAGNRLAFALLFNRGQTKDFSWAPKIREQIVRALVD